MGFLHCLATSLENLRVNKLRSALTMLGVIIGVSAVIIMVSIVEGARAAIISEFDRLGSKLILVVYQPERDDEKQSARRIEGLTMDDVRAIREECPLVESISAEMPIGQQPSRYLDREMRDSTVYGIQPEYGRIRNTEVARGRFLTDDDVERWAKVCLIGEEVRTALFKDEDPIGRDILVSGQSVTVVGVLEEKGRGGPEGDVDKAILVPISTVQKRFLGREQVGVIFATTWDSTQVEPAMDEIWQTLMRRHDNLPGFRVDSQDNILRTIGRVLTIFGLLVGSVAGLSLLVGGIGIMNIMLVSVTERTREIGIRKAVGARRRDILAQFLIESATLCGLGGLFGIGLGAGVAYAIGFISRQVMTGGMFGPGGERGLPVHLPLSVVIGAFLFSAGIGIFFGLYPAVRAARLHPIEALRHE